MEMFSIANVPLYCDFAQRGTVIVFDTETTGLHNHDDIVQLAVAVMHDGKDQFAKAFYLKNQVPLDGTEAQKVNGLTDEFLAKNGLEPKRVLADFLTLIGTTILHEGRVLLVAHNLAFDARMMSTMFSRYGFGGFPTRNCFGCCTKEFVKALNLPPHVLENNKLKTCIERLNIKGINSHDALDDAKACLELFKMLTS